MPYPYSQGQYGQDASMTGQQGQPGAGSAPYGAQQQMPYGQMRTFFNAFSYYLLCTCTHVSLLTTLSCFIVTGNVFVVWDLHSDDSVVIVFISVFLSFTFSEVMVSLVLTQ